MAKFDKLNGNRENLNPPSLDFGKWRGGHVGRDHLVPQATSQKLRPFLKGHPVARLYSNRGLVQPTSCGFLGGFSMEAKGIHLKCQPGKLSEQEHPLPVLS